LHSNRVDCFVLLVRGASIRRLRGGCIWNVRSRRIYKTFPDRCSLSEIRSQ